MDDLITAKEDFYINEEEYKTGRELINRSIGLVNGYINYLRKAKMSVSEDEIDYGTAPYNI